MRLEGRKALVTGGASGIGAAIGRRLAAEGADVWIGDVNEEGAEEIASEVSGHALRLDVTDLDSARAAVGSVGTLDVLVNNAGTDEFGFFTQTTPEQWRKVIAVNLDGVLNCTYAALPGMQEAGYGRIVSISSEAGRVGSKAGFGATTVNLKGGLGSASALTRDGHTVGALAAVNACGSANIGRGPHFWAAPFEVDREFGGLGFPAALPAAALIPAAKGRPGENTTIAVVATDAALTKAQTKELAVMAQDGLARALYPAHTTLDGDTVFAVATGRRPLADAVNELAELGAVAANTLARAVARGVFEAKALPGGPPSWQDCHSK